MEKNDFCKLKLIIILKVNTLKYTKLLHTSKNKIMEFVTLYYNSNVCSIYSKSTCDNCIKMYSMYSLCMIIYMFVQSNHEFINTTHIFIHYVMQ